MEKSTETGNGKLLLLLKTEVDVIACIKSNTPDVHQSHEWATKEIVRTNISSPTLLEEIIYAGHTIGDYQQYMYNHAPLPGIMDAITNEDFHLAGHFDDEQLHRLGASKGSASSNTLIPWPEHLSSEPTSANVLKNVAYSMISGFHSGERGLEPTSPLLDKLRSGNVIIELRQPSCSRDMADAFVGVIELFKTVCEEQDVQMFVCSVHGTGHEDMQRLTPQELMKRRTMSMCVLSASFVGACLSDIDSVPCFSKHFTSHVSGHDANLLDCFTHQFSSCGSEIKYDTPPLFYMVDHKSASLFYLTFDEGGESVDLGGDLQTELIEFIIKPTDDIGLMLRALHNQMAYKFHVVNDNTCRTAEQEGGATLPSEAFKYAVELCGASVVGFPAHAGEVEPVEAWGGVVKAKSTETAAPNSRSQADPHTGSTVQNETPEPSQALKEQLRVMYARVTALEMERAELSDRVQLQEREVKLHQARLVAKEEQVNEEQLKANECREDTTAIMAFANPSHVDTTLLHVARERLQSREVHISQLRGQVSSLKQSTPPPKQSRVTARQTDERHQRSVHSSSPPVHEKKTKKQLTKRKKKTQTTTQKLKRILESM